MSIELIFTSSQSSRPSTEVMLKILDALDLTWSITMGYPSTGQKINEISLPPLCRPHQAAA